MCIQISENITKVFRFENSFLLQLPLADLDDIFSVYLETPKSNQSKIKVTGEISP
jgi:hypothetical protein